MNDKLYGTASVSFQDSKHNLAELVDVLHTTELLPKRRTPESPEDRIVNILFVVWNAFISSRFVA
jgi:hypothetical protein